MLATLIGLAGAALAAPAAEEAALEASNRRLRGMVDSCRTKAEALNASGRVDIDAQAHAGELVSLLVHSEVGNQSLVECFCSRAPIALRDWIQAVEADALISLPFILTPQDGSAGYSGSRESHTCRLSLTPVETASEPEPELPAGAISVKKLKVKGSLDNSAVQAALESQWPALERCYRADLIRWPGYNATANLDVQIGPDGKITAARIEGLAYNSISNCQIQHLLESDMPTSDGASSVKARLIYEAGD